LREYILKKIALMFVVMWGVYTIVFMLCIAAPGDPARLAMGRRDDPEARAILREKWGLNEPVYVQYVTTLKSLVTLDFPKSFRYREDVGDLIWGRLPRPVFLGVVAIGVSILIAIPAGIVSAYRHNTLIDNVTMVASQIGVATPNFWLGLMLIVVFYTKLGWFQIGAPEHLISLEGFSKVVLPAITLGTGMAAITARLTRSSMLGVIREEYIMTARAKGLKERVVILKHAFRNALLPVVTVIGLQFPLVVGGAVLTEVVFGWHGLGQLYISSITARDYPVIVTTTLLFALGVVVINLIVDLLYSVIDPRVKYERVAT
jgi:peptide/nickel transport system permease protein